MHARFHCVQRGGAAAQYEVVAVHYAPHLELRVVVAARGSAAFCKAYRDQLLGEKCLPALRRIARAVEASHEPSAVARRCVFRR